MKKNQQNRRVTALYQRERELDALQSSEAAQTVGMPQWNRRLRLISEIAALRHNLHL
jgi:hypothetical protein